MRFWKRCKLALGGRLRLQPRDLLVDEQSHLLERVAGPSRHDDHEGRGCHSGVLHGRDILGHLQVVDEPLVESRVLSAGEDGGRRIEGCLGSGERRRRGPGNVEAGQLDLVLEDDALLRREDGGLGGERRQRRTRRDVPEPLHRQRPPLFWRHIAGDDHARIGGAVPLPEEGSNVLAAGRGEVGHGADHRPGVRVPLGKERPRQEVPNLAVGLVLDALATLVLDHIALAVHALGRHGFEQGAHSV